LQRLRFDAIWCAMRARPGMFGGLLLLALVACGGKPEHHASPPAVEAPKSEPPQIDAGDWARNVGSAEPARGAHAAAPEPRAAVMNDDAEDSDELTEVVRLVYRVHFSVPASFHDRATKVDAPAGELHIDASDRRLRARFIGPGWPVQDGSEVRLRADMPGVYLFDGRGGRSLGAGQLAWWWEGQMNHRAQAVVGVWKDYHQHPSELEVPALCMLLGEWSSQPREWIIPRCHEGSPPPGWRLGPWNAELTAIVPMQLPRRVLRADEVKPPALGAAADSAIWLEAKAVESIVPSRADPGEARGALAIENRTDTRAVVLAQGVAVGWVDASAKLRIDGLRAGFYRVGAIRPLGILRMAPRLVHVPGELVIGKTDE
jgi:hypothetical protein